jgi:hypothetical protein
MLPFGFGHTAIGPRSSRLGECRPVRRRRRGQGPRCRPKVRLRRRVSPWFPNNITGRAGGKKDALWPSRQPPAGRGTPPCHFPLQNSPPICYPPCATSRRVAARPDRPLRRSINQDDYKQIHKKRHFEKQIQSSPVGRCERSAEKAEERPDVLDVGCGPLNCEDDPVGLAPASLAPSRSATILSLKRVVLDLDPFSGGAGHLWKGDIT